MNTQAMVDRFRQEAEAVSTTVHQVGDMGSALEKAVDLADSFGAKTLAAPEWQGQDMERLTELCSASGITILSENLRDRAFEIQAGLTAAEWGAADTGTLILESNSENRRLASSLSDLHVAILPVEKLRPDLGSLADEIRSLTERGPGYLAFISGASRTADIELKLTIGAHGPLELHIILVGK